METLLVERALKSGWVTFKLKFIGVRGAPDRLLARNGRVVFVELKRPGETTSSNQDRVIASLRKAGVEVYVCDNLKDAYAIIE